MDIKILKNLVYSETEYECLTCDAYLPTGKQDAPVVILIHGGAFHAGSKEMYTSWGSYLASKGIAALAVNYRLATPKTSAYPEAITDVLKSIQFVVRNAHEWCVNPNNIVLMGDSVGAYFSVMTACFDTFTSFQVKGIVSVYGVLDILDWAEYTEKTRVDHVVTKFFGKDAYTGLDTYKEACPKTALKKSAINPLFKPSFLVIWAEKDEIVLPENQSIAFCELLKEFGISFETAIIPDSGHFWLTTDVTTNKTNQISDYPNKIVEPKILEFLNKVFA